ncbi:hypothetical protein BA188_03325 [Aeromonas hydrophila]|nr:hypothetical protein OI72_12380 [Aeromonas hydrophila]OFC45111.1 hypothetical protein BA189_16815 [Aeromonas hydrophila]OFC49317.1 hypothetical protein BA188_03325 [Aeromonas hydrophila]
MIIEWHDSIESLLFGDVKALIAKQGPFHFMVPYLEGQLILGIWRGFVAQLELNLQGMCQDEEENRDKPWDFIDVMGGYLPSR